MTANSVEVRSLPSPPDEGLVARLQKVNQQGQVKDKLRIKFTGDRGVRYTGTLKSHGCYDGKMKTLPSNTTAIAVEGVFRACEL